MLSTLTITAKGQITLKQGILRHLGVRPGDELQIELLTNGSLRVRPKSRRPVSGLFDLLAVPPKKKASFQSIAKATSDGWAGLP